MRLITGNEYELKIESIASDGRGVGHIDRIAVFVPFTVPGDTAIVRITKILKSYAEAEVIRIIQSSDKRRLPPCPLFYECGGCALMHMEYNAQLEEKRSIIENAMRRIGGFSNFHLDKMIGMDEPYNYRNKMVFHAGTVDGKTVFGFYAPKSHKVIPLKSCITGNSLNAKIVEAITEYMDEMSIQPYDYDLKRGTIRQIFIRSSKKDGSIMVVIVTGQSKLPVINLLTDKLKKAVPEIKSIILNINKDKSPHSLGKVNKTIYGNDYIEDEILGITFRISPQSFFQINPTMTEKLYKEALLDIKPTDNVLDIYCGIGTISLIAAKTAKKVTGVEIVPQAVKDANKNAKLNGITNASFFADSAENLVPHLIEKGERPNFIILDPPRKGSDKETINAIIKAAPERIAYVSCHPATLARDAALLSRGGYEIAAACGVDMFPHTAHVECVVLMSRK